MTNWEFPAAGPIEAGITTASGSVAVSAEPTEVVTVSLEPAEPGRGDEEIISQFRVEFDHGRLEVSGPKNWGLRRSGSVDVTVGLPAGSRCRISTASADVTCLGELGELNARTASGDVRAARVSGPAVIKTASGDAWLDEVTSEARLDTASGDLRVERSGADLVASTASGEVSVGSAAGNVTARTASGDVRVDRVTAGEVSLTTVSGDITVGIPAGTGVYLNLSALTGRLSSQLDEAEEDGAGELSLQCRTVSGDIRVIRAAAAAA